MQGKNFLFERSKLNGRTSTMLFEKWEIGRIQLPNVSTNLLPQFNLFDKKQFDDSDSKHVILTTPPMPKKPASTPKAPMKHKKHRKNVDLKPKKLQYSEEESEQTFQDSGIHCSDSFFRNEHTVNCTTSDLSQKQTRRLRGKLDRAKVESNNKENDRNLLKHRSGNATNNVASSLVNKNIEALHQCNSNLDWKETLRWLQFQRDIGLWIQCCRKRCKKWRYVEDYHDPLDVPKRWYCKMNSDKTMALCEIPEMRRSIATESDLIENDYNAGSIVWAYIRGYPWWPAIVNDSPDTYTYYELPKRSIRPIRYFVTFFEENILQSEWVGKKNIKPFATTAYNKLIKRTTFYGTDYKTSLEKANAMALSALQLSILQRLQRFSYLALYERLYDVNNNLNESVNNVDETKMDTNSDDEIPCSYSKEHAFTLKDYYMRVLRKRNV